MESPLSSPPAPPAVEDDALPSETIIRPSSGWQFLDIRQLWQFRDLIYFLIWRDVKVRYKQTVLGVAWAVLQPTLMMIVFTIFFRNLASVSSGDLPYPVFVFAGLLPWTFFATGLTSGGNSVVGSEQLITKIYFPRLAVPFAAVGAALVDFAISFVLLLVLMASFGVWPGWSILLAAPVFLLIVLATAGMATLLAALNVKYRDFRYVIPFLVQVWMFATPTIYMELFAGAEETGAAAGASRLHAWLALNPLTGLVAAFRSAVLGSPMPWDLLASAAVISILLFLAGCLYFRKVEDSFADII